MILNYIWLGFFIIAFIVCGVRAFAFGEYTIFKTAQDALFEAIKNGFTISLGLTGLMTFWLGIMKVAENSGAINVLSKFVAPFFTRLFPEVPRNHPVHGHILMNYSANMLGLDNAATPLGLKAMQGLQDLNPVKDTASNAQIMFLVLNTAGLTLLPVTTLLLRVEAKSASPAEVFIPILLTTFFGTLAGLISVCLYQRINLFNRFLLLPLLGITLLVTAVIWAFHGMAAQKVGFISDFSAGFVILGAITLLMVAGLRKKMNVYEVFIEGAKDGFNVAIRIIPYLVAILAGIAVFRASGSMDYVIRSLAWVFAEAGLRTEFVDALPVGLMKSLSGKGAQAMMIDVFQANGGPDSFAGRLASVFQGSSDTTFYILAVYFGSVGIRNSRYALTCGLIADAASIVAAIFITYLFFG